MTKIISEEKAKQGRSGRQVLMVLIASLLLVFAVWGAAEIYGALIAPTQVDTQTTAPSG